jgi:hypothetical protein
MREGGRPGDKAFVGFLTQRLPRQLSDDPNRDRCTLRTGRFFLVAGLRPNKIQKERDIMPTKCEHASRLWNALLVKAQSYKKVLEEQLAAIKKWDLGFHKFDKEIKTTRKEFGLAKAAVLNHEKVHHCHTH